MEEGISNRIIKPEKCVFCFGIPTSENSFYKDQKHPTKNFAKRFNGVWAKYDYQIVSHIKKIEPKIIKYGVTVVHGLTLQKFGKLLNKNNFLVIILFSHWENNALEFYDGFAEISAIVDEIPREFSGILDLSICHPIPLTIALKKERPNCLVRFTNKEATPYLWLNFYETLFWHLKQQNLTYLKAIEEVVGAFLKESDTVYN